MVSEEEALCLACQKPEKAVPTTAFHTFWNLAEKNDLEPGMYHDTCFWGILRNKHRLEQARANTEAIRSNIFEEEM